MGQGEKNSVRAYVFRFAPQTRTLLDTFRTSQKGPTERILEMSPAQASLGPRKTRLGATVCFSMLGLTLHGSLVLSVAADVVVLPLHTRH
jgi:hypothetical protein